MKKDKVITVFTILIILAIAFIALNKPKANTPEEIIQCIGKESKLYVQDGCPHCRNQENLFGENLYDLTIISCSDDWTKCQDIKATPSWKINNEMFIGVQSIEKLQELTGC